MHIPSEAPDVIEANRPTPNWPTFGKIEVDNLKVRGAQIELKNNNPNNLLTFHKMSLTRLGIDQTLHPFFKA